MKDLIAFIAVLTLWVLILVVAITTSAHAEPIKVNMLGIVSKLEVTGEQGPLSMSLTLQKKVHRVGVKRIAAKGINIVEGWFKPINDPFPGYRFGSDLGVIFNEFSSAYFYSLKNKYVNKRESLHYLAPPLVVNGTKYMGGVGALCSAPKGGFSYSNAVEFNSIGLSRLVHSIHGFMHELIHALGGEHNEAAFQLMHPDALQQLELQINQSGKRQLAILDETRSQVFKCIGK